MWWPAYSNKLTIHADTIEFIKMIPRELYRVPLLFVCWSLTSLCHSNGHIETMPAREINPFTALTRIRSQFLRTQWSTSNHSEWTRLRLRPLSQYLKLYDPWWYWDYHITCTLENTSKAHEDDAFAQIKYRHHVNVVFSVICFNYLYPLSQS